MAACMQSTTTAAPACALQFTPWMPPQIPPTTTYYLDVMTTMLNVRLILSILWDSLTIPDRGLQILHSYCSGSYTNT